MNRILLAGCLVAIATPATAQIVLSGAVRPTVVPCSQLVSAFATAPAGATLLVTGACEDIELRNRTAPLTIRAAAGSNALLIRGLRLVRVENLTWVGGQLEAIGGHSTSNHILGRALSITRGRNLVFDTVHFTKAHRGLVATETQGLTVRNSRFSQMRSDGLNMISVAGGSIIGNEFGPTSLRPSECALPDGTFLHGISKRACETTHLGVWRDGDHADCIQMWGTPSDIRIERNRIFAPNPGWCMGVTMHGITRGTRITIADNDIRTDHGTAISVNECDDCVVRNNVMDRASTATTAQVGFNAGQDTPGLVACGNVQPSRRHQPVGSNSCAF